MPEMKPAYLIAGDDAAKIEAARGRLRDRATEEGGATSLQSFEPAAGRAAPDAAAVAAAIPALSLGLERRYVLVDGVERWRDADHKKVAAALADPPPDLTVVLIARGKPPRPLADAVKRVGGDVLLYEAPRERDLPRRLVADAGKRGFALDAAAARLLVARIGPHSLRLAHELDRLALWAGEGGEVTLADLESMVADTSETAAWSLSDALLERDPAAALALAERLLAQGESVTGLVYALASRLRKAHQAALALEAGRSAKQVESGLGMHPYAARQLVGRLRDTEPAELRAATEAVAELEVWCRGGADYGDDLALTLALRRAAA